MADKVKVPAVLDMFHEMPQKCGIEDVRFVEYGPISTADFSSPLVFEIPGAGDAYTDIARTYLQLKVKIDKAGKPLGEKDVNVAPENLSLHTMWSSVEIQMQQKTVFNSSSNYGYKSYLETLSSMTPNQETALSREFFYKDSANFIDGIAPAGDDRVNVGYLVRNQPFQKGGVVEMSGPLHHDFAQMPRSVLPSGVALTIKLIPARKQFCLASAADDSDEYELKIVSARLFVCKVKLANELLLAHRKILSEGQKFILPVNKTEVSSVVLPQHTSYWSQHDVFNNRVPNRLMLAFVSSKAFQGSFTDSPFNFKHYYLRKLSIFHDGVLVNCLTLDFEGNQYIEGYQTLFKEQSDAGPLISYKEFPAGYAVYNFWLDDNIYDGHCLPPKRQGNIAITAEFGRPLPENCNMILYSQYTEIMKIDKDRNISP